MESKFYFIDSLKNTDARHECRCYWTRGQDTSYQNWPNRKYPTVRGYIVYRLRILIQTQIEYRIVILYDYWSCENDRVRKVKSKRVEKITVIENFQMTFVHVWKEFLHFSGNLWQERTIVRFLSIIIRIEKVWDLSYCGKCLLFFNKRKTNIIIL